MSESRAEVYSQLEHLKSLCGLTATAYYGLCMKDATWQTRVDLINELIDDLNRGIKQLEGMAK